MKLKLNQKTYIPKEESIEQKWLMVDVKGKTLGLVATKIADLLRGKNKTFFTPQLDCGDNIIVINAKLIRLAGNKMDTKLYHWHTRYPAGLRTRTAREVMEKKPEKVLYDAVWGMLPRNRLRRKIIKKLRIFPGEEHSHKSQSPQLIEI